MWPWGHAVVGYLLFAAVMLLWRRELPAREETVVVLVATQLPDLIDKPLAWYFTVLPSGRSLAHSMLTAAVLIFFVAYVSARLGRGGDVSAFGVGYISAILTDLPIGVFSLDFSGATFLLWPLLPSPVYETEPSFGAHLALLELSRAFLLQLLLTALVSVLIVYSLRKAPRSHTS